MTAGRRRSAASLALIGERIARARRARGWTQAELASKVGLTQARISQIEAGHGGGVPARVWFAAADALNIPFRFELGRDPLQELDDSGHLELQEFMLELGRRTGRGRSFELQIRPTPGLSVDVALRDDEMRLLILEECWNTFSNLGASVRNTSRKLAELGELAVSIGGGAGPFRAFACWVVRDAPRNRAIFERYPAIFAATFRGSSKAWVEALTQPGAAPPVGLGFVWCEPRAKRLTAARL